MEHQCSYHVQFDNMQEKELIERHNVWLNDELADKVDSLIKLRRMHADVEAEMSFKLADVSLFYRFLYKIICTTCF